jgi:hypothetical protein
MGVGRYHFSQSGLFVLRLRICISTSRRVPDDLKPNEASEAVQAAMFTVIRLAPRSELEAMLAVQAVATHNAAMECMGRAMVPDLQTATVARVVDVPYYSSVVVRDLMSFGLASFPTHESWRRQSHVPSRQASKPAGRSNNHPMDFAHLSNINAQYLRRGTGVFPPFSLISPAISNIFNDSQNYFFEF